MVGLGKLVDENSAGRMLRWGALEFYAKAHIGFEQLALIYNHADSVVVDDDSPGGPPCSKKPDHPNCRPLGRWVTVDIFPVP